MGLTLRVNVAWMRKMDRVVGNAACSLLASAKTLTRPFARPAGDVKKIAVMKFFGLGSIVVASPTLRALREIYPNAELHFVTFKGNREILEILGLTDVNHFVDPSSGAAFARSTLQTIHSLRKAQIDVAIDLEFYAKYPLVVSHLAGAGKHAGFYLALESWRKTLLDVLGSYNPYYHTKDIFLSLVYLLATGDCYFLEFEEFARRYTYPRIDPPAAERAALRKKLGARVPPGAELIVINPNTSPELAPEARKWPEERYAELASRLLEGRPKSRVAFVGAPSERAYVERIALRVKQPRAFSLAGELSLRELLVLFAEAALVISNDSGPMHLACLADAPTIGLFFADSPTLFAPLGQNVSAIVPSLYSIPLFTVHNGKDVAAGRPSTQVTNAASLTVPVDAVLERARELLVPAVRSPALEVGS